MNIGSPILGGAAIPGDPDGLMAIAGRLQAAHEDVSSVQGRVAVNGLQGSWSGSAAERFRSSLQKLPAELSNVTAAFDAASSSVNRFAAQLVGFQEKASYFANSIRSQEQDLDAAQQRHDEAQSQVNAARLRESIASDPISLNTAADAVRYGLTRLQLAIDDIDTHSNEIAKARREAQVNRDDYEAAVRACCATLQDISTTTYHQHSASRISITSVIAGLFSALTTDIRDHVDPRSARSPAGNHPSQKKAARNGVVPGPAQPMTPFTPLPTLPLLLTPEAERELTTMQQQFVLRLAADTGLDPIVVAAWVQNEMNGPYAAERQNANNNDWLNVGYTDSGTFGAGDAIWSNPLAAADATAMWLKGQNSVRGYLPATPRIRAILATAGGSPQTQISAIQGSGWASSGEPNLLSTYERMAQ
jgi:uncharacterized protein YukE